MTTNSPWKNLRGGAPVALRIGGQEYTGIGEAVTDAEEVTRALEAMLKRLHRQVQTFRQDTASNRREAPPGGSTPGRLGALSCLAFVSMYGKLLCLARADKSGSPATEGGCRREP